MTWKGKLVSHKEFGIRWGASLRAYRMVSDDPPQMQVLEIKTNGYNSKVEALGFIYDLLHRSHIELED